MPMTTFSVRMDEDLKKEFDELCVIFGMNTSVAINIFARAVVREQRIPFEISASTSERGLQAFQKLRLQAKKNGLQEMTLDDINREIALDREGK